MMKRLKGFTLVELIVVTAIIGILMSALMNFYRPIRQTFVDSTMLENVRTSHDGMLNYLTENLKYAENLAIYDDGATVPITFADGTTANVNVTNPSTAFEAFMKEFKGIDKIDNGTSWIGPDYTNKIDPKYVHVIIINRASGYSETGNVINKSVSSSELTYHNMGNPSNRMYTGRIIVNIVENPRYPTPPTGKIYAPKVNGLTYTGANYNDAFAEGASGDRQNGDETGGSYMALGGAYYGASSYGIYIDKAKTWVQDTSDPSQYNYSGAIHFVIQNTLTDETGVVKDGGTYNGAKVTVDGGTITVASTESVKTMNCKGVAPFNYYTSGNKVLPEDYSSAYPAGSFVTKTGDATITNGNKNTYIVFTEPLENEQ